MKSIWNKWFLLFMYKCFYGIYVSRAVRAPTKRCVWCFWCTTQGSVFRGVDQYRPWLPSMRVLAWRRCKCRTCECGNQTPRASGNLECFKFLRVHISWFSIFIFNVWGKYMIFLNFCLSVKEKRVWNAVATVPGLIKFVISLSGCRVSRAS